MDHYESTRCGGCGERNPQDEPHLRCRCKEHFLHPLYPGHIAVLVSKTSSA